MNTLNFKVLLKNGFFIFLKALGIYLVMTIPTFFLLPMYLMSAVYAISFGWIAAVVFLPLFIVIMQSQQSKDFKKVILCVIILIAVLIAFQMMEVTGVQDHIWREPMFLFFPAAAVLSGWISLLIAIKKMDALQNAEVLHDETSIFSNMQ